MAGGNKEPDVTNGIFVLASFVLLFAVILLLFMICVYRGQFNISWRRLFFFAGGDPLNLRNVGLNARVVESLPVFENKAQSFKEALECAICLSEFEENEKARLLPNCKHSFHVDCIDMWFRSHSTCPICRTGAQPKKRINLHRPGLEQGETSSQEVNIAVDEGPSTSGISSMPDTAVDISGRPERFSSERQVCLHDGSQSLRSNSLKRMLSRGREGRVFPDAHQDHVIETRN